MKKINIYQKIKIFSVLSLILFLSAVIITNAKNAIADSVAQVQTTKFFAPETVNLLKQRIAAGNGGNLLKAGDTVSYIITFTPVANGANIGAGGYITDYIPPNTQVVGAEIVRPDGFGGYVSVPVGQQAYMPDGWGQSGSSVFGGIYAGWPQGNLAQLYADTGIFYSTDPRTSLYAGNPAAAGNPPVFQTPTPGVKATQSNGYITSFRRSAQFVNLLPNPPFVLHNYWDTMMTYQFGSNIAGTISPRGNTPYGAGSAVAGPDTFYSLDYTGAVGPWQRIAYPGSTIGHGSPATVIGTATPVINGISTSAGYSLSPSNPLPLNTNAVRFSFGKLQVGQFNYVKISLKLLTDPPASGLQNNSEVIGGDAADVNAAGTGFLTGGRDSPWLYAAASVAENNSGFYILKEIVSVNGTPSNGQNVTLNDVIRYRVTYINTGTTPYYVKFDDVLSMGLASSGVAVVLSGPNVFPAQPTFTATLPSGASSSFPATPILLSPGTGGSFQIDAQVINTPAPNSFVSNTVIVRYGATATTLDGTQQSVAVSNYSDLNTPLPPNITQSKSASPNSISPGSSTVYTITINNTGNTVGGATLAQNMTSTITDTLPAGFSYTSGSTVFTNSGVTTTLSTPSVITNASGQQVITWTIPAGVQIAPNTGVWKLAFSAATSTAISPGVYNNDFSTHLYYMSRVGATYMDTITNQTAPVTVSNTRLLKTTSTPTVYMTSNGATAHYQVTMYNDNAAPLSGIGITDTLPSGFSYRANSAYFAVNNGASSSVAAGNITTGTNTVSFNNFTLAAHSSLTVDFDVNIATSANIGINNNSVSATALLNGVTPVTIPVFTGAPVLIQPQGLVVNKFVSDAAGNPLPAGQNGVIFDPATAPAVNTAAASVYYTIELINSGNAFAPNVGASDILPTGFVYNTLNNASISYRQSVNNVVTTILAPASTPVNDPAKAYTVMPKWSVFNVPPQQNGVPSKILITFPMDIRMQSPVAVNSPDVITSAGVYQNTVSADGANNIFSGAPVDVFFPVAPKVSVTKTVARGNQATYTITILNNTSSSYTVNISDVISDRAGAATQLWPFVSDTLGVLAGGATRPAVGATALNWTNIPVPVGGLTFNFTVTVPAAQAVAIYDNRVSLTIPPAATTYTWDGRLAANTVDDVSVVLTMPTPPTLIKNTLNAATKAGPFTIASSAAPVYPNTGGTIWYEIVVQNNSPAALTLGTIVDTLPAGFRINTANPFRDNRSANYIVITRPIGTISGTIAGANITNVTHGNMAIAGQNVTFPAFTIPASTAAVPQGFELAIIFRATVGTAAAPTPPGQYANTFTVNDPNAANPPFGSYNGANVDVSPITVTKTILPASNTVVAGGSTQYTIEVQNTNTTPITFSAAAPLTVTDVLPYKTIAGAIPAASPVAYVSTASVYTVDPLVVGSTVVVPTTSPVTTLGTSSVWTFQNLTIPAASNGASGKLVINFIAAATAAAPDGIYPNTVNISFVDPTVNSTLTSTDTYSGANLTIATLTATKTASVSFVPQTLTGASTGYQIRVQNPGAAAQTIAVMENLPFGFVYNPVAGASQSTATAVFVNRTTQASGAVSVVNIRNANGVGNLAAPNSQFYIASTAGALFVIPANTDLYINLNNIYIDPSVTQGTYYNNLSIENNAGQQITSLNNTAPVTVAAPQMLINKTTTTPVISKSTVNAGTATVHYDITVTNIGNASATGVVLTDVLPRLNPTASPTALYPNVIGANTVVKITNNGVVTTLSSANYSVIQSGGTNTITFNSNPAGGFTVPAASGTNNGTLTIGFDVSLPVQADIGMYYNTANATSSNAGTLTYASGSPFSITAFGITKSVVAINGNTANKTSVNPGDKIEYQIIGFNTGPNDMPNVNITDVLPSGFTYVLGSASITHTPIPPATAITNPANPVGTTTLVWSPISTASNSAVTINFYVLVGASTTPGTYYNTATINDGGTQTVTTGNTAPVSMVMNPNMTILKSVSNVSTGGSGATASPGDTLKYTMTVILNNNTAAQNIYVTDNLDNALDYIQGSEIFEPLTSGLTLATINYYGRPPGYVFISSTATIPASATVNTNIGRVIYNLSGQMVSQSQQFRINFNSKVQ